MARDNLLQAGVAVRDISPDRPELLRVYWSGEMAKGVNIPIKIKALVLKAGEDKSVIVAADQRKGSWDLAEKAKQATSAIIGCSWDRYLFTTTHSHLSGADPTDMDEEGEQAYADFQQKIEDGCIQAILEANEKLDAAEVAAGQALLTEPVGVSRQTLLSDGSIMTAWGAGAVAVPGVKLVGPVTPDADKIDVLCMRRPGEETPFASLTGYGSHIHVFKIPYFCAETAGGFQAELEKRIPGMTALQSYSTGGNMDMHLMYPPPDGDDEASLLNWYNSSVRKMSRRYADAVEVAVSGFSYTRPSSINHLRLLEDRPDLKYGIKPGKPDYAGDGKVLIQAIGLGDIGIVNIPGELFHEFYEEIHKQTTYGNLIITGLNETLFGYVGPPISFERGGYEVKGTPPIDEENRKALSKRNVPIARHGIEDGTRLVKNLKELLERTKPA